MAQLTRSFGIVALMLAGGISAFGQAAPTTTAPSDNMDTLRDKMQEMRMKVLENMRDQGVNPMEFMMDIQKRMADGSLDMEGLTQELVDKNLIDQKSVDDVRTTAQRVTFMSIKEQLGSTDEEWAVLLPRIKDVLAAMASVGISPQSRAGNPLANLATGPQVSHDVRVANAELKRVLRDKAATNDQIQEKMKAVREAKSAAMENLTATQKALVEILTPRQEAILANLGLVP